MITNLAHELALAARTLRRHVGFAGVAVLTLGLGIGATTAIATLLKRVVLDPLPYPAADRMVRLMSAVPGVGEDAEWQLSSAQYFYFRERSELIEELGGFQRAGPNVLTDQGPVRARAAVVAASTLRLLGAQPVRGRLIDEQDDRPDAPPVAVLSHGFWQREFGGDPGIVGRTIGLNEAPYQVVGVMAPGVELPDPTGLASAMPTDIWVALRLNPEGPFHNSHVIPTIARLRDGVPLERARTELERLTAELPEAFPQVYSAAFMERYGFGTRAYPLKAHVLGDLVRNLWILLAAVGLVLLIASANVVNLFLVRAEARRREIAVRAALGAGRGAIARHFLAEALILALAGGAVGLLLAVWGVRGLVALAPAGVPRLAGAAPDAGILLFTLGLSLLVALGIAAVPALRQTQSLGVAALAGAGRSATAGPDRQRIRGGLVAAQVGLALVLIVGAGLLIESLRRLQALDPGVQPDGVLTMQLQLPEARYPDPAATWRFFDNALEQIRALPGVAAAGVSGELPFLGGYGCTIQGFEDPEVAQRIVAAGMTGCAGLGPTTPGYFEALGIPLFQGRTFTPADNDQPTQPAVYGAAVIVLGSVALLASWIPARRAARVDPTIALRVE